MTLTVSRSLIDQMRDDAAASPDAEICGLLFGDDETIAFAQPCRNVAANPARAFEIDPVALVGAYRAMREGGPRMIGHYHSHPSGNTIPSARDAAAVVADGTLWLIVADDEVRAWRTAAAGAVEGRFDPLRLVKTGACAADAPSPEEPGKPFMLGEPMPVSPVDFASLLCSRLCHDLLSPVGALNNGLELLADEHDPEMRQRCLDLLAESARSSANKLKFFRLAFGAAGGFGEMVDAREARAAIEGLIVDNKRLELVWAIEDPTLPKSAIKVLLNLSLIAVDALIRGGTLTIGAENHAGQVEIVIHAEGQRIVLDAELRSTLVDGEGEGGVSPRAAAAYLVHALVAEGGGSVQVSDAGEGALLFGAVFAAG